MTTHAQDRATGIGGKLAQLLREGVGGLASAAGERVSATVGKKVGSVTERLTQYTEGGGSPGLKAAATGAKKMAEGDSPAKAMAGGGFAGIKEKVKGLFGKGGGKGADKNFNRKVTNIVETIDVGVPIRVAYNQWTQFEDFPSFTKKVESVKRESDEKSSWKAQVWWSHRSWEATIVQQVPDSCIIWRSKGQKGRVDGTVTFHELAPELTRILVVLEYHPQGLFEQTGNLWRAQGRRARLEIKHFRRHVMTRTILKPDEVEGWRGEIRDGEVVKDHETALEEEEQAQHRDEPAEDAGDDNGDETPDEADEPEPDEEDEEAEPDAEAEPEPDAEAEPDDKPQRDRRPPARPRQASQRTNRPAGRAREDA
ncbi:SRPBCC family protein [Dactylosporangium sp. NPDC049525]|uniref:SRPBCC family protein n=1 Tax=Dactylosporangium sp. NPDC049525 TaxID=3154730 RepID=UPI003444C80D